MEESLTNALVRVSQNPVLNENFSNIRIGLHFMLKMYLLIKRLKLQLIYFLGK